HQIIRQNGYQLKTYTVTTLDGYILTMFRIPPRENDNRKNKQPVYIQHGIAADSATWVATGNRSLAFNLADEGYDVWLGNQRGTRYSRKHAILKDSDFEYWNYNLDDQALNDIRTSLHEIERITRKRGSIIYIGHSKGTTLSFMFASQYPEEAQTLLRGVIALSPIAYLDVADYLKFPVMVAHRAIDDLLVIYSHFPSTVSLTDLQHYAQMYTSKKFQKFDFGPEKNLEAYGQRTPPRYHLDNIKLPVFLFYGKDDPWVRESVYLLKFKLIFLQKIIICFRVSKNCLKN
ncbi:Abhydro lipase domain containing protein, partial [Asbolus verrucosus]